MTVTAAPTRRPRIVDGTELIGEYRGSGYEESRYLVKRADGQMVALSHLLYLVVTHLAAGGDSSEVAERVSAEYGRLVSSDNIDYLVEQRLQPLGIADAGAGAQPHAGAPVQGAPPARPSATRGDALQLTARASMLPPRLVNAAANALRYLFAPSIIALVAVDLVIVDLWLINHGIGAALEAALLEPLWLLILIGGILASAAFHELGHAAACRYGGAQPGAIGVGLYLIWPAFYTDVTDSYRLSRAGRLRTDLGGIYFNVIFALGTVVAYTLTGWEPLLLLVVFQHVEIVHQFMPVVRLDGYYVVSDLAGVPDLFKHVGPTFRNLGRRRSADTTSRRLRPHARRIITAWLLITAPVLALNLVVLVLNVPRIFSTAGRSLEAQARTVWDAAQVGEWVTVGLAVVSILLLALPVTGITLIFTKLGRSVGGSTLRWARLRPSQRLPLVSAGGTCLALLLSWAWW